VPARGKFELNNQDSAGGKNFTVLKGIGIRQLFSLKMALAFHQKGFTIPKAISDRKK